MHDSARLRLVVGVFTIALLASVGPVNAVAGDPQSGATEAVTEAVAQASMMPGEISQWLLPPGTVVDGVEWAGNVAEISLTVPADRGDWTLSPLDQEAVAKALASAFAADADFGGTRIMVRAGTDQPYDSLEQFLVPRTTPAPAPDLGPTEVPQPFPAGAPVVTGPTAQAVRQPVGALTGVTVFAVVWSRLDGG